mgnify:CR=1 FL=1
MIIIKYSSLLTVVVILIANHAKQIFWLIETVTSYLRLQTKNLNQM